MQFVDEQDHAATRVLHFAQDGFEPLFEFAAKFRAGNQRPHVERDHPLVLEALRNVALHDPQRQTFGDRGFADAWFTNQHRIVLRPPGKDLDHTANFLIATDHGIELALLGACHKIDAIFFQGLEFGFGALIGHARRTTYFAERCENVLLIDGIEFEHILRFGLFLGKCEEQMLGRHIVVLHRLGLCLSGFENPVGIVAQMRGRSAACLGQMLQFRRNNLPQLALVRTDAIQKRAHHALLLFEQRREQVNRLKLGIPRVGGQFVRPLHRLLGLDCQFVETECHGSVVARGWWLVL